MNPLEVIANAQGEIRNVGHVAVIFSKAGTVRSNHYHKKGWHYLYVVSGLMRYFARPAKQELPLAEAGLATYETVSRLVHPGEVVLTEANVAHRTEFCEDTLMISFASENQGPEHHDEDLVKIEW